MQYPYTNKNLGITYSDSETIFNVWAPTRESIHLALYKHHSSLDRAIYEMKKSEDGVFTLKLSGDYHGYFYTFIIDHESEITDPYSYSTNSNSLRSAIIDLKRTNPEGFIEHQIPSGNLGCDAIIYELHIKDFTWHKSSNCKHSGKFLALTESNTQTDGYATGLDHLSNLGITHVHLMPINDFLTVDENEDREHDYNWGYDPEHFNVPEGSYSTSPSDPISRIYELKFAIMELHKKGLKVILDVVYNHTYRGGQSNFNALVPNYYFRVTEDGIFSNGSGCGNEFASEKPMARRFIIDSLCYWAAEFKVDGFRFDLMALIDIETINQAKQKLEKINPDIMIYGEPWTGGLSLLPESKRVYKGVQCGKGFSLFNDDFRNAIKGDNDGDGIGFVQGNKDAQHAVKTGILGSIPYNDYHIGFALNPCETINYFNAHDNLIIFDKVAKSMPSYSYEDWVKVNKLCFDILFMSQGIPFFHAGNEFLRTKKGHHNSYNAPLSINGIDWNQKKHHYAFYSYVKDLIRLRKKHSCFRLKTAEDIKKTISFLAPDYIKESNSIIYTLHAIDEGEYDCLLVVHNASPELLTLSISEVLRIMCCDKKTYTPRDIEIKQIFNESGMLEIPDEIPDIAKHVVGINPFSTSIYSFKKR